MKYTLGLIALLLSACTPSTPVDTTRPADATSFLGTPLFAKAADSAALVRGDSAIAALRGRDALQVADYLTLGRLYVSTNRFQQAIDVYSEGLKKYPDAYQLLRFRGHRYLNLRQVDKAYDDLTRAEELSRNLPDEWETDAAGKPVATYRHQIWYHIGICHYFRKEFQPAIADFEKSLAATHEGKNIAGASDWLYNSCQRAGLVERARAVAAPFTASFDIEDKDYPYFRRLLLYNGVITPDELVDQRKPVSEMSLSEVTKLYGLASYYAYNNQEPLARKLYGEIVKSGDWQGFAVAAAEIALK